MLSEIVLVFINCNVCFSLSFVSFFFVHFTASKDLAQTSYFMATNRLLSCPSFVALWLHTIASCNAGYPFSVQRALLALVVDGTLASFPQLPSPFQRQRDMVACGVTGPSRSAVYCTRDHMLAQKGWMQDVKCSGALETHVFVRLQKSA